MGRGCRGVEPAESRDSMAAASESIAAVVVADDAVGLGEKAEASLASQRGIKLRFDRQHHLAHCPLGVFSPEA